MKLRNFRKALRRGNIIKDVVELYSSTVIADTTISGATIAGATLRGSNISASSKLVIPTTAYTGASPTETAIYVTGSYLFVGYNGSWMSAALA